MFRLETRTPSGEIKLDQSMIKGYTHPLVSDIMLFEKKSHGQQVTAVLLVTPLWIAHAAMVSNSPQNVCSLLKVSPTLQNLPQHRPSTNVNLI